MSNSNNLSVIELKNKHKEKYSEKKRITLGDNEFTLDIDQAFDPIKKQKTLDKLLKLFQNKIKKLESPSGEEIFAAMLALVISEYTSIDIKGIKTFEDYVEMFVLLDNENYLNPILMGFNAEELKAVIDEFNNLLEKWIIATGELPSYIDDEGVLKEGAITEIMAKIAK